MPMKSIDFTPFVDAEGALPARGRLQGSMQFGSAWPGEMDAQLVLVERLRKFLNDRYTLIRNFTLPAVDVPIPLILIGPTGMWVIYAINMSGFFAAQGKEWLSLDNRSGEYRPSTPNPIVHTLLVTRALVDFMQNHGLVGIEPEPVILFTDPGIDVTTEKSEVRIVLIDALNRFVGTITHREQIFNPGQIRQIADLIVRESKRAALRSEERRKNPLSSLGFSPLQWIVLGTFLAIILIASLLIAAILLSN